MTVNQRKKGGVKSLIRDKIANIIIRDLDLSLLPADLRIIMADEDFNILNSEQICSCGCLKCV